MLLSTSHIQGGPRMEPLRLTGHIFEKPEPIYIWFMANSNAVYIVNTSAYSIYIKFIIQSGDTWRRAGTRILMLAIWWLLWDCQRKMRSRTDMDRLLKKIDSSGVSKDGRQKPSTLHKQQFNYITCYHSSIQVSKQQHTRRANILPRDTCICNVYDGLVSFWLSVTSCRCSIETAERTKLAFGAESTLRFVTLQYSRSLYLLLLFLPRL